MTGSAGEPRVIRADNPSAMTLDGTRTYIVGTGRPIVIDPGPRDEAHVEAIVRSLGGARPLAILLTHLHEDHAGAAPMLARRTAAPVLCASPGDGSPAAAGLGPLEEGQELEADAGVLRAIRTPGHAPEHTCFHWSPAGASGGGAAFVGDLMMGSGDTTLVAFPEGDLRRYLLSLDRMAGLGADVLYPAHGDPITDPRAAIDRYRRHRAERIAQVESALRTPPATLDDLLDSVYGGALPATLRGAARGSVLAILEYLERDGRIDPAVRDSYTPQPWPDRHGQRRMEGEQ